MATETRIPEEEIEEKIWPILAEKCEVKDGFAFLNSFCKQQYPNGLNERNPAHKGVIKSLQKISFIFKGACKVLPSTLRVAKDKEKEKEEEEEKEKGKEKEKETGQKSTHKFHGYFGEE